MRTGDVQTCLLNIIERADTFKFINQDTTWMNLLFWTRYRETHLRCSSSPAAKRLAVQRSRTPCQKYLVQELRSFGDKRKTIFDGSAAEPCLLNCLLAYRKKEYRTLYFPFFLSPFRLPLIISTSDMLAPKNCPMKMIACTSKSLG